MASTAACGGLACLLLLLLASPLPQQATAMQESGRAHIAPACSPGSHNTFCTAEDTDQWQGSGSGVQRQQGAAAAATAAADAAPSLSSPDDDSAKNLEGLLPKAQQLLGSGSAERGADRSIAAHIIRPRGSADKAAARAAAAARAGQAGTAGQGGAWSLDGLSHAFEYADIVETAIDSALDEAADKVLTAEQVWQRMQERARSSSWDAASSWEAGDEIAAAGSWDDVSAYGWDDFADGDYRGYDDELTAEQLWENMQADGWAGNWGASDGKSQEADGGSSRSSSSSGSGRITGGHVGAQYGKGAAESAAEMLLSDAHSDYSAEQEEMRSTALAAQMWHALRPQEQGQQGQQQQGGSSSQQSGNSDSIHSDAAAPARYWHDEPTAEYDYSPDDWDELPVDEVDGLQRLIEEGAFDPEAYEYGEIEGYEDTGLEDTPTYYYSEWAYGEDDAVNSSSGMAEGDDQPAATWGGYESGLLAGSSSSTKSNDGSSSNYKRINIELEQEMLEASFEDLGFGALDEEGTWDESWSTDAEVADAGASNAATDATEADIGITTIGPGGATRNSMDWTSADAAFRAFAVLKAVVPDAVSRGLSGAQRMWDAEPRSGEELQQSRRLKAGV